MQKGRIECGGVGLSREELLHNAARVASGLTALGAGPGDRVAMLLRNSVEFIEISNAVGRIGAYSVPINWHFRPGEIEAMLDDCLPKAIFVHRDLVDSLPAAWTERAAIIMVAPSAAQTAAYAPPAATARPGAYDYAAWRDACAPNDQPPRIAPGSMIYTSGTTGRPKGVERRLATPEQLRELRDVRLLMYHITPDSRVLVPGPLYHALPNQYAIHAANEAAHVEIMARFDAEELLAIIERERITSVALAPIMFVRLLRLPPEVRSSYDLSSLQWALHAGGPCAADVKRAMIEWWGPIIAEYYGGTETGPLTLCDSAGWLSHPGTCGRPLPGVELRIVNHEGRDVPQGTPGEIFGRLRCYPDFTYRNDPEKRAAAGLGELVSLGDVGYLDSDGYLYLCDRARDMIISGGVNIYPAEIEGALFGLPGVEDCAVIGVPDAEFGESVAAFVVGQAVDPDALRRALRERIAGYKVPREIILVPSLDRDVSGKLRKAVWKERYLELKAAGALVAS